jgi:hypothetical protein
MAPEREQTMRKAISYPALELFLYSAAENVSSKEAKK